ncbi:aminodeoxychorismate lyase [Rhodanobacter sp. FW510-R12]|uniref:endolytic transglycosylase MltG n=1 Tax=unclassified Rhodanobacter TaxID=2621553 RepID=UPI0007AA312D|nr:MULTISPECIES: endolytic transglycosylase MltG [unclassified Rhodanobacter]KZC17176.1 aminodeoxychorismate lyase [Rhodanobacter sp. FW104-R8]KZC28686.1 aminodeoxychorismate lyase [Rhodanobacter sp. FW510-T8]KZC29586.1 aminodeoxychorismate lyase [Rhodanobacter sp. FW510-R10]
MSDKPTRKRAWPRLLLIVLLVAAGALAYGWNDYARFGTTPLNVTARGESIDVGRGSSFKAIVGELRQRGFSTANSWYWRLLARQTHVAGRLHAGEYALEPGITPRQLLANMAAGKVLQRNVTIVDGWTFGELRQALARAEKLNHDSAGLDDAAIMQKIGAGGETPEGRFLPETYAYVKGDGDLDILRRAHAAMVKTLDELWAGRAQGLPLASPYEALILASIVEKETGRPDERAQIAGVFVRRLRNHMLLQTDPSVIYGMGASYAGNIHKSDLTTDTPYNTYTRAGLPPTPIALPGKPALVAALHPADGDTLYFVARGDGGHVFSRTLEEHNRNVDCYQRKRCR